MQNQEMDKIDSSSKVNTSKTGKYAMEQNLIFAQSDALRIFTYEESSGGQERLTLRTEFALNDRVLDVIGIPTDQFTPFLG